MAPCECGAAGIPFAQVLHTLSGSFCFRPEGRQWWPDVCRPEPLPLAREDLGVGQDGETEKRRVGVFTYLDMPGPARFGRIGPGELGSGPRAPAVTKPVPSETAKP